MANSDVPVVGSQWSCCEKASKVAKRHKEEVNSCVFCKQCARLRREGCNPSFLNSNKVNMGEMSGLTLRLIAIDDQLGRLQASKRNLRVDGVEMIL